MHAAFFRVTAHSIEDCAIPLSEMKSVFLSLRRQGFVGKFLGELLTKVSLSKGPMWVTDKWDQSGLQLINLIDPEREDVDKITMEYVSVYPVREIQIKIPFLLYLLYFSPGKNFFFIFNTFIPTFRI